MIFVDDLARYAWMLPAPIGTVEDGLAEIVADLLRTIDDAVARLPDATVDILETGERDGELRFGFVVDRGDEELIAAIKAAVVISQARAAATCLRCGQPGRLRRDRPAWPTTRCDAHAWPSPPASAMRPAIPVPVPSTHRAKALMHHRECSGS